jgi:hypothetical protein
MKRDDREIIPIFICMKCLNFYFATVLLFISSAVFAQTPQQIEADLLKSFKKVEYWKQREADTTIDTFDSLEMANEVFGRKLQYYTRKYPFTLTYKFPRLGDYGLTINRSPDGNFNIYSWDTETGGTMHCFSNVFQYRSGKKTQSFLDTASLASDRDYVYCYSDLFSLNANDHTYYAALYFGVFSGKERGEGLRVFSIENGKLTDAKIIKTRSGLHAKLYYNYDLFSIPSKMNDADFHYDPVTKTISFADVGGEDGITVTDKKIIYKFTGQYFERIRN